MPRITIPVRFGAVRLAFLFSAIFHGALILAARYRLSYDAYNHMFFGDHYRLDWWSLWEPRWYTGFYVNSYPPLVHQLIGAASHIMGIDAAFGLILWIVLTLLPLSVYSFTRVFLGRSSAGYAAIGAAFLPSVYLTAHIFGQLPTLSATVLALFGAASLASYLQRGKLHDLALTVSLVATAMAAHHATLLFQPFLFLAVVTRLFSDHGATDPQRPEKRSSMLSVSSWLIPRLALVILLAITLSLIVIWPFWEWGREQAMQTPIDHASRHSFLRDPLAALIFFLPMYGPLMGIIPPAIALARRPAFLGLGIAFLLLFFLGLGGTTPLPRLIFGAGWEWLTYDRFALWASLLLLPFFGMLVILFRRRHSRGTRTKIFLTLAMASLIVGLLSTLLPLQPGAVDMRQVVRFLETGDRADWRYITLGFGDQFALLSTLTTATTIDGSYHTARTLPELRTSGIAQIDTAFWQSNGLSALEAILQRSGAYGVRWGFVNIPQYVPALERNGWVKIKTLRGGVQVWENPEASLPPSQPPPPVDPLASFSWGTFPMLSLITSLALGSLRVWEVQATKVLRGTYAFLVALLPVSLGFWYFRRIGSFPHDRVYFIYTDALFFLSDALVLLAVILWLSTRIANRPQLRFTNYSLLPSAFCLLTFLSLLWSRDWRTSLSISLQVLLIFLFVLSLRDWSFAWKFVVYGFCAALSFQVITGLVEFMSQSTAFLAPLHLTWPGPLDASVRGAVIVQLPNGESFLRAYGTVPHPNILGGLTLTLLLGPIALFLRRDQPDKLSLLLVIPGISLLALAFSRSAWLALFIFCLVLLWKRQAFDSRRLLILLMIIALTFVITLFPYRELVQARTVNTTSHAEEFSFIGRAWLNGEAVRLFQEFPLTGVGIGSFIIELGRRAGEGYVVEPAHNILLLAGAELGLPGLSIVSALWVMFAYRLFKTQSPSAVLAGATLAGLGFIALFDHYVWTMAPGRVMLGLVIGLFVGQELRHET